MAKERPESEIKRLVKAQDKARNDEIFGGLSAQERSDWDGRQKRINDLSIQLAEGKAAKQAAKARKWTGEAETDTARSERRQPYGSRENYKESASGKKRPKGTNESDQESGD